jgi:hypothetical protein
MAAPTPVCCSSPTSRIRGGSSFPVQRRLAEHDALSAHVVHTASAVFALAPPGASLTPR